MIGWCNPGVTIPLWQREEERRTDDHFKSVRNIFGRILGVWMRERECVCDAPDFEDSSLQSLSPCPELQQPGGFSHVYHLKTDWNNSWAVTWHGSLLVMFPFLWIHLFPSVTLTVKRGSGIRAPMLVYIIRESPVHRVDPPCTYCAGFRAKFHWFIWIFLEGKEEQNTDPTIWRESSTTLHLWFVITNSWMLWYLGCVFRWARC